MDEMDRKFEKVYSNAKKYITKTEDLQIVRRAYEFAKEKHEGVFRKDGSPYIRHPIETAEILVSLHAGPNTIAAGFLHDVVEDVEEVTEDTIKELFGTDIANLVMAVTKVVLNENESKADNKNRTIQKVFKAMSKDVRTIIIKIADRLNNMRTMDSMKPEKQVSISTQTLELYAPAARYIGLNQIARELEELSLKYINKDLYDQIVCYVEDHKKRNKKNVEIMANKMSEALTAVGVKNTVYITTKEIYKIYKFLSSGRHTVDEITDMDVIHILVDNNLDCYLSLGVIHSVYTPLVGRLKDYITTPKYNMYQALHTVVVNPGGMSCKIAIATKVMDDLYNYGVANKWRYDENKGYNQKQEQEDIRNHLSIIRELDRLNGRDKVNPSDYVKLLQEDIFNRNQYIYVYNSVGEVMVLPYGATVLDFAFKISDQTGLGLRNAYVNGIPATFNEPLKNGSIVNVESDDTCRVSQQWTSWATTAYAKLKMNEILDTQKVLKHK